MAQVAPRQLLATPLQIAATPQQIAATPQQIAATPQQTAASTPHPESLGPRSSPQSQMASPRLRESVPLPTPPAPRGMAPSEQDKGLSLGFRLPDGTEQTITFPRQQGSLGVDIGAKRVPLTVKNVKPGGLFESYGVGVGWQIVSINGERCENKSLAECMARIKGCKG